jgi:hypothetical protein
MQVAYAHTLTSSEPELYACYCIQVETLLAGQPLLLQLAGLDHMSDDPTDMHVLYLKVSWCLCIFSYISASP